MSPNQPNNLPEQIPSPVPFWFLNGPVEEWHVIREFEMMLERFVKKEQT